MELAVNECSENQCLSTPCDSSHGVSFLSLMYVSELFACSLPFLPFACPSDRLVDVTQAELRNCQQQLELDDQMHTRDEDIQRVRRMRRDEKRSPAKANDRPEQRRGVSLSFRGP